MAPMQKWTFLNSCMKRFGNRKKKKDLPVAAMRNEVVGLEMLSLRPGLSVSRPLTWRMVLAAGLTVTGPIAFGAATLTRVLQMGACSADQKLGSELN